MGIIELAVDDTLCRKRGLTVCGTGMRHDPLISSRPKPLTSWGHDWVVITLIVRCPFWAGTKVWSLPIAFRLNRNREGVTKGKTKKGKPKRQDKQNRAPNHCTRPELAVERISLVATRFPDRKMLVTDDSAYGGQNVLGRLPVNVELISHVHPKGILDEPAPAPLPGRRGRHPKKGRRLPGMAARRWACGGVLPEQSPAQVDPTQVPGSDEPRRGSFRTTFNTAGFGQSSPAPGPLSHPRWPAAPPKLTMYSLRGTCCAPTARVARRRRRSQPSSVGPPKGDPHCTAPYPMVGCLPRPDPNQPNESSRVAQRFTAPDNGEDGSPPHVASVGHRSCARSTRSRAVYPGRF